MTATATASANSWALSGTPLRSLADRLAQFESPAHMLHANPAGKFAFGYLSEYMSWATEQDAWRSSAVLFDQSRHMDDARFRGRDVKRLFSEYGVNSFAGFGRNRAKQFVACTSEGAFVGDNILFGLEEDEYSLVGVAFAINWMIYHAEKGGYDVEVTRDERTPLDGAAPRWNWRYQLNGPATQDIVSRAADGDLPEIPFFRMAEFTIAGTPVRALNHTMAGVPGREFTGLELWGPREHATAVLDALLAAGQEFGLRRGGERAYLSAANESGWIPVVVPGIYTSPDLEDYRRWLKPGIETFIPLDGSFHSDVIEDYYLDPWDLGYGHLVRFDHDFVGRDALERLSAEPKRRKVWLEWNVADASAVIADALFAEGSDRPRLVDLPNSSSSGALYDEVRSGDELVGFSTWGGYTTNMRRIVTTGILEESVADGAEVIITWGRADGGRGKALVLPHRQRELRAIVHHRPLV